MAYVKNKIKAKKGKIMKPYKGLDGRMKVRLSDKYGKVHEEDVAELVARSFPELVSGKRMDGIPYPLHKDGDVMNNAASNLYWPTKEEFEEKQ